MAKSVYVNLNGMFEVEVDENSREGALFKVGELVHDDSIANIEVIITNGQGIKTKAKLLSYDVNIDGDVYDEDGIIMEDTVNA